MNDEGNKIVLISKSGYSADKDALLLGLIVEPVKLFCAVGRDCEMWEEVMDELCVGDGSNPVLIPTTSHPGESLEDVIEFAQQFVVEDDKGIRVIET
jgi:hypothetical protein